MPSWSHFSEQTAMQARGPRARDVPLGDVLSIADRILVGAGFFSRWKDSCAQWSEYPWGCIRGTERSLRPR